MSQFYADYPVTGGVTTINGITGPVTLIGAGGVTITPNSPVPGDITITGSGGTVTSVGLADDTGLFTISGSPVTSSGTLTLASLNNQAQNSVFAGPVSGGAGTPSFRALVSADIPSLSAIYVTQSEVGQPNGVASLDGSGKVPSSQLPSTLLEYQGLWNPSTNTPTLQDSTGTNAFVYQVNTAFAGPIVGLNSPTMTNFQVGNLVIYSSAAGEWQQVDALTGVTSVNGAIGAVTVANTALSNLTATSVNQSLNPVSTSGVQVLGTASNFWGASYISTLNATNGNVVVDPFNQNLQDSSGARSIGWTARRMYDNGSAGNAALDWQARLLNDSAYMLSINWTNRTLNDSAAATQLSWSTSGIQITANPLDFNTNKGINLANPTNPQDAMTLAYANAHYGTGSGSVTSVSVVSANGFAGTVATATTTPAITLSTTITGILKGNGTAISVATAGTDYVIPSGSITGTAGNITATSNSTLTTLTALSLPGSQVTGNISGNAANVTGIVTVPNGGTGLATLTANNVILGAGTSTPTFVAPGTSGNVLTSNGTTWVSSAASTFVAPTVQKFTSGSGTYTLPTSPRAPLYIRVTMVGDGGGGSGSSTPGANNGGNGGNGSGTTFGGNTAGGGVGALGAATLSGGTGGTATLASGFNGVAVNGGGGGGNYFIASTSASMAGNPGAASALGGGAASRSSVATSPVGTPNTGGGGAGGGGNNTASLVGGGGGSGAYICAITTSTPSSTYSYSVGGGGGGGSAGTSGEAGGAGGSGLIVVEEFYQ